jgi:Carboxypeptidase regulatory-like domain
VTSNPFLKRLGFLGLLLSLFLCAGPTPARFGTGSINGSVSDPNGAVVSGATITVICDCNATECKDKVCKECCPQKSYTATTNDNGEFRVSVPNGSYSLKVVVQGFSEAEVDGIKVTDGSEQRVNVTLKVGSLS